VRREQILLHHQTLVDVLFFSPPGGTSGSIRVILALRPYDQVSLLSTCTRSTCCVCECVCSVCVLQSIQVRQGSTSSMRCEKRERTSGDESRALVDVGKDKARAIDSKRLAVAARLKVPQADRLAAARQKLICNAKTERSATFSSAQFRSALLSVETEREAYHRQSGCSARRPRVRCLSA
jgi:hypothetical protein